MTPDFYGELGVEPTATLDEIRRAFRRLAAEHDPTVSVILTPDDRARSAARTERVYTAWKVLSSEEDRLLYDQCLARGYDFERVHGLVAAETEAQRLEVASAAHQALEDAVTATARGLEQAVRGLAPDLQWAAGDTAEYFDVALAGTARLRLVRVHVKVLPSLDPASIAGVIDYAEALLGVTEAGMTRVADSYLMVSSGMPAPEEVARVALDFNTRRWRDASRRHPRAFLAYAAAVDSRLLLPGVDDPEPDLRLLDI